jgi:signal peptidase I
MTIKLEYVTLDKYIYVYKNLLPSIKEFVNILKESESNPDNSYLYRDWKPWATFGSYVYHIGKGSPEIESQPPDRYLKEQHFLKLIHDAFYKTTEHFLNNNSVAVDKTWQIMGPSISKYSYKNFQNLNDNINLSMLYHTDYKYNESEWPEPKFALTCTMYLNDDYDGGSVLFQLPNNEIIEYKPEEGDIMVFPSGHPLLLSENGPYYHAVKKVSNKDKYLVRCFYQIPFEGSENWHKNVKIHGEENWKNMESERVNIANDLMHKSQVERILNGKTPIG